jgi:predicted nucleic acid-binding protein
MRIYLDCCCLNRPYDNPDQGRVEAEASAVLQIQTEIRMGEHVLVSSDVLFHEVNANPDASRRASLHATLRLATIDLVTTVSTAQRGAVLMGMGFKANDALHLACAEQGNVDVFLTTDDRLLRCARRSATHLGVRVLNPTAWLEE